MISEQYARTHLAGDRDGRYKQLIQTVRVISLPYTFLRIDPFLDQSPANNVSLRARPPTEQLWVRFIRPKIRA